MKRLLGALAQPLAVVGGRARRVGWESGFVQADGARIHYGRTGAGSGKPVIVLVHGLADSGACWAPLTRRIEATHDVVFYDVRGHGLSDRPATGYLVEDHVRDLAALLAALGIDRPILMGHSMGGGIVAQAVSDQPELACAAILEDPAYFPQPGVLADVLAAMRDFPRSLLIRTGERLRATATSEDPAWTAGDAFSWVKAKLQVTPRIIGTIRDLPNIEGLLPRIQVPTLLIKADASSAPRRRHIAAARGIVKGKLVHIEGAGHSVHRDRPAHTEAVIREFLAGSL